MKVNNIKLFNYSHYIFFFLFFLLGLSVYKDYGFNIDESFHRRSGFYWLNFLTDFFKLENLSLIAKEKFTNATDFTMPWGEIQKAYIGVIFDVPAALIEVMFDINDPLKFYALRHLLVFLFFFIGTIFFYKLLINRFNSKSIALIGCSLLILTPRLIGEAFHNSNDIVFLTFFIISIYYYFEYIDKNNTKNIILFALFAALTTSVRLFGLIFPLSFLFIYFLSILSNKDNLKKINLIIFYLLLYFFFLILFWPYLWSNPIENFIFILSNMIEGNFGSSLIYFHGEFYNTKLLPYYYLPLWILISTPIFNILLFSCGFFLISKIYICKLFLIEKNDSKYDFWNNNIEIKDFFIVFIFLVFLIYGTFFTIHHYNSWRVFYFINFFIVYFSVFFINFCLSKKEYKKFFNFFSVILILSLLFNTYRIFIYHPYQSIYFNVLTAKKFKNKFEADFTGLSGIHFLREITKIEKKPKIKIGINSWYPLWRMTELLPESDRNRIVMVFDDIDDADYVYSNRIYNVNINKSDKFKLGINFKNYKTHIVDGVIIYEVFKKIK